jgi:hypothetical protein
LFDNAAGEASFLEMISKVLCKSSEGRALAAGT